MKIPTSTSFVMAATASLALQSSALVMPQNPDSPDVGNASPHTSGRPSATAQFPGQAPKAQPDSDGRSSSPNRSLQMREAGSTDSINALMDGTSGLSLNALGLGISASDKGLDKSAEESGSVSIHARQVPVPVSPGIPGAAGSVTSAPGQAANGVVQQGSSIPSTAAGIANGANPQGISLPPLEAPLSVTSLAAALPTGGVTPSLENAPVPAPVAGLVQRDADDPSGSLGEVGQISGGAGQTVGGVTGTVGGTSGQIVGGTPAGSVVGNAPLDVPGIVQGTVNGVTSVVPTVASAAGSVVSGIAGALPVSQATSVVGQMVSDTQAGAVIRNVLQRDGQQLDKASANAPTDGTRPSDYTNSGAGATPFDMLQGQADPDDGPVELTSPSSTVAAPSTSPIVADPTDSTEVPLAVSTNSAPAEPTSAAGMKRRQNLPINPASVVPDFIPSVPIVSSALSSGVSAPVSAPTGAPGAQAGLPQVIPSLPVNPLVNPPVSSVVSLPGNPPTERFIPMKRKLSERADPASPDLPLPSGFAAPTAPIKGDTPPLLMSANAARSVKDNVGVDVSASLDNPPSATSTVQPGTTVLPTNAPTPDSEASTTATVRSGTSTLPESEPISTTTTAEGVAPTASTPTRRRRFFRFNREEHA